MASRSKGWTTVAFGDVVRKVSDRVDPETSGLDRYVAGEHMDTDDLRIRRWGVIGEGYLGPAFHMRFKPGQVLYGSRRTYLRKVAVPDFEGVTANTTFVLEPKDPAVLLPELLPFVMSTESFHSHSIEQSKGSVNPYVNFSDLASYEFDLPPLDEQRRISRLMTTHVHGLESIRVALERATQLREAMLLASFPPASGGPISLETLVRQGDLDFQTGPFGTVLAADEYRTMGWPVVNPSEMRNGEIHRDGAPCVSDETALRLQRYRLKPGDILLARKGDFSKAVIADEQHEGWVGGSDTIRLRVTSGKLLPRYLYLALQAPSAARMLDSYSHGTVMPGLNERMLGRLVLKPQSLEDQQEIVNRITQVDSGILLLRQRAQQFRSMASSVLEVVLRGIAQ